VIAIKRIKTQIAPRSLENMKMSRTQLYIPQATECLQDSQNMNHVRARAHPSVVSMRSTTQTVAYF